MAEQKISEMTEELSLSSDSYFETIVPDAGSPTGYSNRKVKLENFAAEPVGRTVKVWRKFKEVNITSATTSFTVDGLDGDADGQYKIYARIANGYAGSCNYGIRPNGISDTIYGYQVLRGDGSNAIANGDTLINYMSFATCPIASEPSYSDAIFQAKSGGERFMIAHRVEGESSNYMKYSNISTRWDDTTTNVTSIEVVATENNGIGVGSCFEFWREEEIVVAGGSGGLTWQTVSSNTSAEANNGYIMNGASSTVTLTLPASPSDGDTVGWKALDITNALTIARNGENIEGLASDLNLDVEDAGGMLVYTNQGTIGWTNVTEINGGGSTGLTNERILGFFGMLTSDQTGLSNNTEHDVDLTAQVDPESGWSAANDEFTVPAAYDGMNCFASAQIMFNDVSDPYIISIYLYVDSGTGYEQLSRCIDRSSQTNMFFSITLPYQYIGVVNTGDKVQLRGSAAAFAADDHFVGDSTIRYTFLQLEFQE